MSLTTRPVTISIIICTQNHCGSLRHTLRSLNDVCVPEGLGCELIVVDNACTDDTADVVRSFRWFGGQVRYTLDPRRGLSHARNTGVAAARGDVLLFTDDDLRLPSHWIEGMCAPILSGKAHAVAGGVTFAPHLERPWMELLHRSWLASTDRLDADDPQDMVGANMAFSRDVLTKVPAFDTELGPGALGFGDDTLFSWQIKKAGFRLVSALDVCVEHHFDEPRLLRSGFLNLARKQGQTFAYLAHHWEHTAIPFLGQRLVDGIQALADWGRRWPRNEVSLEGMPCAEMELARDMHFNKRYLVELQRPRQYEQYGLAKIRLQ